MENKDGLEERIEKVVKHLPNTIETVEVDDEPELEFKVLTYDDEDPGPEIEYMLNEGWALDDHIVRGLMLVDRSSCLLDAGGLWELSASTVLLGAATLVPFWSWRSVSQFRHSIVTTL